MCGWFPFMGVVNEQRATDRAYFFMCTHVIHTQHTHTPSQLNQPHLLPPQPVVPRQHQPACPSVVFDLVVCGGRYSFTNLLVANKRALHQSCLLTQPTNKPTNSATNTCAIHINIYTSCLTFPWPRVPRDPLGGRRLHHVPAELVLPLQFVVVFNQFVET